MSNNYSKVKAKCLEAIRTRPGILQSELFKMGIGHRQSILKWVFSLCFEGSVVRVRDSVMPVCRLYPKGKEPLSCHEEKSFKQSLFQRNHAFFLNDVAHKEINKGHGEKFRMAFDEAYKILYIDLRMIAGACSE